LYLAIYIISNFLNEDKQKFSKNDDKPNNDLSFFEKRRIEKEVQKIVSEKINLELSKDQEIINLEEKITQKISENLSNNIVEDLENRFSEYYENENLDENLYDITNNIDFHLDKIQKNSIVNLIIGILGTIISISILSIEVLSDIEFKTVQEFLIHFLPRVTLVVFIQLFAFFFLRLYKNNLEDAKYFQNELTNLTAKTTSIKIASLKKNDDLLFEIVRNLSNTERNFKLSKEESLQTIENKKINSESDKDIMAQLKDILSKFEINKTA
jgi:hypothetical protein